MTQCDVIRGIENYKKPEEIVKSHEDSDEDDKRNKSK